MAPKILPFYSQITKPSHTSNVTVANYFLKFLGEGLCVVMKRYDIYLQMRYSGRKMQDYHLVYLLLCGFGFGIILKCILVHSFQVGN